MLTSKFCILTKFLVRKKKRILIKIGQVSSNIRSEWILNSQGFCGMQFRDYSERFLLPNFEIRVMYFCAYHQVEKKIIKFLQVKVNLLFT